MPRLVLFAIDLVAVSVLVFGLYFPRHRRRDLVVEVRYSHRARSTAGALAAATAGARP